MRPYRAVLAIVLVAAGAVAGWRVLATAMADQFASSDPLRALQWDDRDPDVWFALGTRQLRAGDRVRASASARRLLAIDPVQGRGFVLLAEASPVGDDMARERLYRIAARRAPRDVKVHAWLADAAAHAGRPAAMLAQVDAILRLSPRQQAGLLPLLAQMTANPAFADALVAQLRTDPPWRAAMLATLSGKAPPAVADHVFAQLRAHNALGPEETRDWLQSMLQQGRWSTAYSHWSGIALASGQKLTAVYNGGFEQAPTDMGFDWRLATIPGVHTQIVATDGASGTAAAHVNFLGRPVPRADLEQPLLLAAGRYTMHFRARAGDLRSDQGLRWTLTCSNQAQPFAQGPALDGSFDWQTISMAIDVPVDCPGQWLRLTNPAPGGSSQSVSGDAWFDDFRIMPVTPPSQR